MCNKVRFTKKDADAAIKHNKRAHNQYRKEVRDYYCEDCNAWHLTSKPFVPPEEISDITEVVDKERWEKLLKQE